MLRRKQLVLTREPMKQDAKGGDQNREERGAGLTRDGRQKLDLLAATGLGGSLGFGEGPLPESYFPGQGGVLGFVKCLGFEWPEVLVRVVDLDPARPAAELAERLLAEAGDPEGPLEVGYSGARRVT